MSFKAYTKLIKTCKYFFAKKQLLPIWSLRIERHNPCSSFDEPVFLRDSLSLCYRDTSFAARGKKLWIGNAFKSEHIKSVNLKITKSHIQYLTMEYQKLKYSDYYSLVKNETLKELNLEKVQVLDEKEKPVPSEVLMKFLPNAYHM